jgi:hypothetical protein
MMLPPVVAFKKILKKTYANDIPKRIQQNFRSQLEKLTAYSPR